MSHLLSWGYLGIFLLMILENIVPPIPSEAIMTVGGIAVAHGRMSFVGLVAVGTAGTVIGNLFWWEIGRRLGYRRLRPLVERWSRWLTLDWDDIEKLKAYFDRWGGPTVLIFRFMPLGRTLISVPAGLLQMPFWRFVGYTAIGSTIWNVILLGVGFGLGKGIADIDRWVAPAVIALSVAVLLGYLWRVVTWKPRG